MIMKNKERCGFSDVDGKPVPKVLYVWCDHHQAMEAFEVALSDEGGLCVGDRFEVRDPHPIQ